MGRTFTQEIFLKFREFIHNHYGIYYADIKKDLLCHKLDRCLKKSGIDSYESYFSMLESDYSGYYLKSFIDEITVNKTNFFRENQHYSFIQTEFASICSYNTRIVKNKEIRIWSMACSTGQEAYTIAMVLKETLPKDYTIKILATDISNQVLKVANAGIYPNIIKKELNPYYIEKYFTEMHGNYHVKNSIKSLVTFRQFNMMNPFPVEGKFDIIFCRNVMIYFDLDTQRQLLEKIYDCLITGGLLFIGQAESLLNKNHKFKHIESTIYIK